ncbi:MAG: MBL fold metallo-hydrolase [Thermodesulfovibrionales bacterium]|nr:MBL fold metallo-hydrolase [Thermodesulfovibrionales bacterium]
MEDIIISPQEFKKKLDNNEVRFVFDLRSEDDFKDGKVEGRYEFQTLNLPQEDFVGEEDKHIDKFPKDIPIITICAHGDSSRYTAEWLREKGFNARSLEGGIDLWSEYYETSKISDNPAIYQFYRVARGCISYLINSNGEGIVIDAMRHIDVILKKINEINVKVKYVIDTHLQADHISGGREIAQRIGAKYFINPHDAKNANYKYEELKNGDKLHIGNSVIEIIHSPGHTPGSTSLLLDGKYLFTGDLIMKTSIGRPDLGGASEEWTKMLFDTLFKKYAHLSDDTIILPTHASSIREQELGIVMTTMGKARKELDLYQIKEFGDFFKQVSSSLPPNPERYQEIRKVNLGLLNPDEKKAKELEIGKNLCGMSKNK